MSVDYSPRRMEMTRTDSLEDPITLPSIKDLGIEGLRTGQLPPAPEPIRRDSANGSVAYQPYQVYGYAAPRPYDVAPMTHVRYPDTPPQSICSSSDGMQRSFNSEVNEGDVGYWHRRSEPHSPTESIQDMTANQSQMQRPTRTLSPARTRTTTRGRPMTRKRSAPGTSSPDRKKKDQRNAHQKDSRAEEAYWIEINAGLNKKLFEAEGGSEKFKACARPVGENNRKQTGSDSLKIYRGATKVSELRMLAAVMMKLAQIHADPESREKLRELLDVYQVAAPPMSAYQGVVPGLALPVRAHADGESSPKRQRQA